MERLISAVLTMIAAHSRGRRGPPYTPLGRLEVWLPDSLIHNRQGFALPCKRSSQSRWPLRKRNATHPSSQRSITGSGGLRLNFNAPEHRELRENNASWAPFRPRQSGYQVVNHSLGRSIALRHYPGRHLRSLYSRALALGYDVQRFQRY
jgi:hypothetical protein